MKIKRTTVFLFTEMCVAFYNYCNRKCPYTHVESRENTIVTADTKTVLINARRGDWWTSIFKLFVDITLTRLSESPYARTVTHILFVTHIPVFLLSAPFRFFSNKTFVSPVTPVSSLRVVFEKKIIRFFSPRSDGLSISPNEHYGFCRKITPRTRVLNRWKLDFSRVKRQWNVVGAKRVTVRVPRGPWLKRRVRADRRVSCAQTDYNILIVRAASRMFLLMTLWWNRFGIPPCASSARNAYVKKKNYQISEWKNSPAWNSVRPILNWKLFCSDDGFKYGLLAAR